jgi:hypothetical protein
MLAGYRPTSGLLLKKSDLLLRFRGHYVSFRPDAVPTDQRY